MDGVLGFSKKEEVRSQGLEGECSGQVHAGFGCPAAPCITRQDNFSWLWRTGRNEIRAESGSYLVGFRAWIFLSHCFPPSDLRLFVHQLQEWGTSLA